MRTTATLIGSGGVRCGLDVAKTLAVGADMAAAALPFLEPATRGADAVASTLELFLRGLRIALFASGCRRLDDLRDAIY